MRRRLSRAEACLPEGQLSRCRLAQFNWPPNCIVPLQIAQVQVSTELLEVSGMDSKGSSPKTVLPKELACRRPPAAGLPAAIAATGSAIILVFLN